MLVKERRTLEDILHDATRKPTPWLIGTCLFLLIHLTTHWWPSPDSSSYISMARNIAAHGVPMDLGRPSFVFQIGYAYLIAPCFFFSDQPFLLLSMFNIGAAMLLVLGVHRWLREYMPAAALLVAMLIAVNVGMWDQVWHFHSDLTFTALLVWTAIVLRKILNAEKPSIGLLLLGTGMLVLLCMVRYIGISAGVALGLGFLCKAYRGHTSWLRALLLPSAIGLPAVLAILALLTHNKNLAAQYSTAELTYVDWFGRNLTFGPHLVEGLRLRIMEIGRLLIPGMYKAYAKSYVWININFLVYIPLAIMVVMGYIRLLKRRPPDVLMLVPALYVLIYIIWPLDQTIRYFFPISCILWVCVWAWLKPLRRVRLSFLFVLVVLHALVTIGYMINGRIEFAGYHKMREPVREFIKTIGPDEIGQTMMVGCTSPVHCLVMQEMDRRSPLVEKPGDVKPEVNWVFASPKVDMEAAGFKQVGKSERLVLWNRIAPATAPAQ